MPTTAVLTPSEEIRRQAEALRSVLEAGLAAGAREVVDMRPAPAGWDTLENVR